MFSERVYHLVAGRSCSSIGISSLLIALAMFSAWRIILTSLIHSAKFDPVEFKGSNSNYFILNSLKFVFVDIVVISSIQ